MPLLLLFICVPLIEIALFIQIGGLIGLWPTLATVLFTAIAGAWLVRSQGVHALGRLQAAFNNLEDPTEPLAHGAMILFSGALLLTPGFFTDGIGFLLLVPDFRIWVFGLVRRRIIVRGFHDPAAPHQHPGDDVIDADYEELDPSGSTERKPSGWTK